jgi:hypothetical protein
MNNKTDDSSDRALIPVGPNGVILDNVDAMFRFARCYLQSGLAPFSFKNEQQLVIAWSWAAELGLSPLQATAGLSIINNRVGIMGDLGLAMVEARGLLEDKKVVYSGEGENLVCDLTIQRKGRREKKYSFSVKEAKEAGLLDRRSGQGIPAWIGYPKRMTYYRALGFALRDEFSDVMKGIKTTEELQDYPDSSPIERDEAKIASSQARDAKVHIPGAKFVEPKGTRPTPKEAAEPAFDEDLDKPVAPPFAQALHEEFLYPSEPPSKPRQQPVPTQNLQDTHTPPDDLDMSPVTEAAEAEDALTPPPATVDSPVGGAETLTWKDHVILGVDHVKFHNRKVGELNEIELGIMENQWLPAVREEWDRATDIQRADAAALESAIAYRKTVKPW